MPEPPPINVALAFAKPSVQVQVATVSMLAMYAAITSNIWLMQPCSDVRPSCRCWPLDLTQCRSREEEK